MDKFKFLDGVPIPTDLKMVIVVPCYDEIYLTDLLDDLYDCSIPGDTDVEIYFIFNASEEDKIVHETNRITYYNVLNYVLARQKPGLYIHAVLYNSLPERHAGVGLARKIGMDEACRRLKMAGCIDGLIVNLDADCSVPTNYFHALMKWSNENTDYSGCSIYFEHPLPLDPKLKDGIVHYELHLRYYIEAQRYAGIPYAFQTVGSAMCVRANVYEKVGGMNVRKAGEDFYFIHKIIKYGKYGNLDTTTIYPSARISERVPFGTGRAMAEHLIDRRYAFTYPIQCFEILRVVLDCIRKRLLDNDAMPYELEKSSFEVWNSFLEDQAFSFKWVEIYANCRTAETRIKRFYLWFDAFRLMKFCHFYRDYTGNLEELPIPAIKLAKLLGWDIEMTMGSLSVLDIYRKAALNNL